MIFERIVMTNVGPYRGRNEVPLTPVSSRRPIVLFGALNGSGKTTLIDSLKLALYGKNASCASRGKLAYDAFLKECINHDSDSSVGASIELELSRFIDSTKEHFIVRRAWKLRKNRVIETLEVLNASNQTDALKTEYWDEFVEELIPRAVADLFFFDGEKIEELADPNRTADIIRTGLHSLLGLDVVDRLSSDLKVVIGRRSQESATHDEQSRIAELDKKITNLLSLRADLAQSRANVRTTLDRLEDVQIGVQENFRLEGGDLYNIRDEIERDLSEISGEINEAEKSLRNLAAGRIPLMLVERLLDAAYKQSKGEDVSKSYQEVASAIGDCRDTVINALRDEGVGSDTIERVEKIANENLAARHASLVSEDIVQVPPEVFIGLDRNSREDVRNEVSERVAHVEGLRKRSEALLRKQGAMPSTESLAPFLERLDSLGLELRKTHIELEAYEQRYNECVAEVSSLELEKERLLEHAANSEFAGKHNRRVINQAQRIQATLRAFRENMVNRHLEALEGLVTDATVSLFRKTSFIQRITIEPSTYELKLFGEGNREIPKSRLSAGERQLIAVGVLWALARASGKPIPTVIDTPLGRLDGSHRTHLVEHYFPSASHQVILLSTDTEIDKGYRDRLKPALSHEFVISYNNSTQSSTIRSGYFW